MPYLPSWRASLISRAAWASVRTGTGPSLAAIPPNSSRVTSAVRAPRSAARSADSTPAGPAPMTTTSNISGTRFSCLKIGKPAQGPQSRHEAILATTRNDKPRQPLKAPADRSSRNYQVAALIVGADDGILGAARPEENAIVYPLRLDELELASQVRPHKGEQQPPVGPVVLQYSFPQRRTISCSAAN